MEMSWNNKASEIDMPNKFSIVCSRELDFSDKNLKLTDLGCEKVLRYRSIILATFVVALGNISLFLGGALTQGNLEERVKNECSIANIKQYVAQIEKKLLYDSNRITLLRYCFL
jgi:hypothetical protein